MRWTIPKHAVEGRGGAIGIVGMCMESTRGRDGVTALGLWCAVAAPVVYFGAQLVGAAFYPGYSFVSQSASMLGSDLAKYPWILNTGAIVTGLACVAGSVGYVRGLKRVGGIAVFAWLTAVCLALSGIGDIKAGIYPLPDPRHGSWGFLGIAMILMPVFLLLAVWKLREARGLKFYLGGSILLIAVMFPVMTGMIDVDRSKYDGLIQRVFAVAVFPPIGVGAWWVKRKMGVGR